MTETGKNTDLDPVLIERYGVNGPRYTSYPTALQFTDSFGFGDYQRAAENSNNAAPPLALYVHIPYCWSLCYYCACTKIISQHPERAAPYLEDVLREARLVAQQFDPIRPVTQIHLGGGTPTFCTDDELEGLIGGLKQCFWISSRCEISIEIDPRTVDAGRIGRLAKLGFNRLSMGIQDFDPQVQSAVNRIQPVAQTVSLIEAARDRGFRSVSVDLIYGLPLQTEKRFERTIESVIDAAPDRISLYSYAHLPQRFKAQRLIRTADLPSGKEKIRLLTNSIRRLAEAGYEYIGMDHFARADDELAQARQAGNLQRNFQGYSTHAECDMLGLGISSISRFGGCFSQNTKKIAEYHDALASGQLPIERGLTFNDDDEIRADVIQRIMCDNRIDYAEIDRSLGIDFCQYFASELESVRSLEADGLVRVDETGFDVTPRGRLLLRAIAMPFDAYLGGGQTSQFSKVI